MGAARKVRRRRSPDAPLGPRREERDRSPAMKRRAGATLVPRPTTSSETRVSITASCGQSGTAGCFVGRPSASTIASVKTRRSGAMTALKAPLAQSRTPSADWWQNWITPPGRGSMVQDGVSAARGPNQRAKCSATVHTSNTSPGCIEHAGDDDVTRCVVLTFSYRCHVPAPFRRRLRFGRICSSSR
jgi:hypothetical protein